MSTPTPPFTPKRKRLLTRPVLKFVVDVPRYIRIEGAIYVGKDMKQKEGEKKKEPAHLADVVDLSTGELAQIIVNAVPLSVLTENYPNDSYVGKCFLMMRQSRQPGKQYDSFKIEEIEDPTIEASPAEAAAPVRPVGGSHRK